MNIEHMEMEKIRACRELFIFGSWKRKNGRRAAAIAKTISPIVNDAAYSNSTNVVTTTKRKKPDEVLSESHGSSMYRPASCESSFTNSENRGNSSNRFRNDVTPTGNDATDEDDPRCPRCGSKMTEPRLLDCLHSICTYCVDELLDRGSVPEKFRHDNRRRELKGRKGFSYGFPEGCPVCDYPLPRPGSSPPPPHYPLQHRLLMNAVRRRLSDRILCCDVCTEDTRASLHCPTCLGNFCTSCGTDHRKINNAMDTETISHDVRPLWEAKRFRRTALCLDHPSHALRFHCVACQRVTCRECMWRGTHRGHCTERASEAGKKATVILIDGLRRARNILNSVLIGYDDRSFSSDEINPRPPSTYCRNYYYYRHYSNDNRNSDDWPGTNEDGRCRSTLSSYTREALERINEFARLQKARHLIDAISLGEEIVAEGSDVEILSLSKIILKRLRFVAFDRDDEIVGHEESKEFQDSRTKHSGIFHCCTFCSSGGKKEATCACEGTMPGDYRGCGHGHPGHPRVRHWSCCGSTDRHGCCPRLPKLHYQMIL